jgi:hypothetical protein
MKDYLLTLTLGFAAASLTLRAVEAFKPETPAQRTERLAAKYPSGMEGCLLAAQDFGFDADSCLTNADVASHIKED